MKKIALIFLPPSVVNKALQKEVYKEKFRQGYNSFYCKINGKSFSPGSDRIYRSPQLFGGYSNNFSVVRITAKCTESDPHKYVIIELNNFNGIGEYLLSDVINDCRYEEFYPDNIYRSALTRHGKITITKDDRVNFILAGTFEFTAANTTNTVNEVSISKGYFNLKL